MSGKRIVFRCSFGGSHGWGHVTRCSALASAFRERGWQTALWSDGPVAELPDETASAFDAVRDCQPSDASVLCIDEMYTPDDVLARVVATWRLENPTGFAIGIDDMQRRHMGAFDLVINTEIGLREARYAAKRSLLGERFALLRSGFRQATEPASWDLGDGGQRAVFVMIGGTDPFDYAKKALEALDRAGPGRFAPMVVLGARGASAPLKAVLDRFPASRLLQRVESPVVASWMRRCDFGIIGCGTTPYEAAATGMPFIGLSLVDNQTATAAKIARLWRMPVIHLESQPTDTLELAEPLASLPARSGPYSAIDNLGAIRAVEEVEGSFEKL